MKPDDMLTTEESALVKKAEREMCQGKFVTLAQLRRDLDRPRAKPAAEAHPFEIFTGEGSNVDNCRSATGFKAIGSLRIATCAGEAR